MSGSTEKFKSGFVSIVGRPNTGKSTLLNSIVKQKVAIVSKVPQTTRTNIRGIYTDEKCQIVFIDTPGVHLGKDKLDNYMNQSSEDTMEGVDCIIYLVDLSRRIGKEEQIIAERVKKVKVPVILGLNKVDLNAKNIPDYLSFWEKTTGRKIEEMENFSLIPLSGKQDKNLDKLVDVVCGYLPEGPLLYPADTVSDVPQRLAISDIIREKFFNIMHDELPHSIGVTIESMQPKKSNTIWIKALVFVERDTHKEIVIGKQGSNLKKVGTQAREELEALMDSKVFLELFVKVEPDWRNDVAFLKEVGY